MEEAGDHFTPREVIRLMVQLIFTGEDDVYRKGIYRSIYDPTAGTGGMLSEAEKHIKGDGITSGLNPDVHIALLGQEYNPEAYAICCADLLIKDEPIDNLIHGDTLGIKDAKNKSNGFIPHDGHPGKTFHYMLANPPYGVEWKPEEDFVREEYKEYGFDGRFGAGLPRIHDGSLLFLQHMISKRMPSPDDGGDGSKIAIVFNGSPLFTGDAGSGESNIRRWIIENDWLDAIVALPDQMSYNTGTLAPRSVMIEKANLAHLLPELEKKLVCDIEGRDVISYQQKRIAENASPKTVNLEIGTLRAILKHSGQWARLQPEVNVLATRDDIGRAITPEEESALLQACGKSRSRSLVPFVTLAIETGARYGVIRTLQWGSVDFENRCLKWGKDKTAAGTGRVIPLSQRATAAMNFWATHFPERKPEHYVFPAERYGAAGDAFCAKAYDIDPTKPIGSIKDAWESAKLRAGKILKGNRGGLGGKGRVRWLAAFTIFGTRLFPEC